MGIRTRVNGKEDEDQPVVTLIDEMSGADGRHGGQILLRAAPFLLPIEQSFNVNC